MSVPDSTPKHETAQRGADPDWIAPRNFIMVHIALVQALDGDYEAAMLFDRINYYSRADGWWEATKAEMQEETCLTEWKLDRAIKRLREAGFVEWERVSPYNPTLKWRCAFREGQNGGHVKDVASFTERDATSFSPSSKKDKNPPTPQRFDEWWSHYPNKKAKQAALKVYAKTVADGVLEQTLISALQAQEQTLRDGHERGFCPHPATWLNQGRWDDDVTLPASRLTEWEQQARYDA